jgi:phospholipid/cholesterol/gamma-HCH transport system substrate-binding protein
MYKQKINYVIIGVFVTAMLSAGVISAALLTGRTGATDRYFVLLDNVADVKFGTQIRYEGYPIGQVDEITPVVEYAGMKFRVEVSVQQGWRIPSNSIARIGSSSFLAAKTIDIESGDSDAAVAPGNRIPSAPPIDIFSTITATAGELSELNRTNIKPLLQTLQSLAETVEGGTPRILDEVMAFTEGLNSSLEPLQEILASHNIEAIQRSVQNVEEATGNLAATSRDLTKTMPRVANMVRSLDRLVEDNEDNVDQSLKDIQYTLSSVAATVDSIVHNLEGSARNMNEFSRLIRQNPGLLLDGTPREAVSPARATVGKDDNGG